MQGIGIIDVKGYYDNENDIFIELRLYETPTDEYYTVLINKNDDHKAHRYDSYEEALEVFNAAVFELVCCVAEEEQDISILDLELSNRTKYALIRAKILTLQQLIECSELKLRRVCNLGTKSIKEIKNILVLYNVQGY